MVTHWVLSWNKSSALPNRFVIWCNWRAFWLVNVGGKVRVLGDSKIDKRAIIILNDNKMGISKLSPEQLLYVQNCLDVFFISGNIFYVFILYISTFYSWECCSTVRALDCKSSASGWVGSTPTTPTKIFADVTTLVCKTNPLQQIVVLVFAVSRFESYRRH